MQDDDVTKAFMNAAADLIERAVKDGLAADPAAADSLAAILFGRRHVGHSSDVRPVYRAGLPGCRDFRAIRRDAHADGEGTNKFHIAMSDPVS